MTRKWKMTIDIILDGSVATPADFGELIYSIFNHISRDGKFRFEKVVLGPEKGELENG